LLDLEFFEESEEEGDSCVYNRRGVRREFRKKFGDHREGKRERIH